MTFHNLYSHGFVRVAAQTFPVALGQPDKNAETISNIVKKLDKEGVAIIAFPELCLTGSTLEDVFQQSSLLNATRTAIKNLAQNTTDVNALFVVGAPIELSGHLFNCAIAIQSGEILAVIPQFSISSSRQAWFSPASALEHTEAFLPDLGLPLGPQILTIPGIDKLTIAIEIGTDATTPIPLSATMANNGVSCLIRMSSEPAAVRRASRRLDLHKAASEQLNTAIVYAGAGAGESTNDFSFDGHTFITELGETLAEGQRYQHVPTGVIADIDLNAIAFAQSQIPQSNREYFIPISSAMSQYVGEDSFAITPSEPTPSCGLPTRHLRRPLDRFPFVPNDENKLNTDCEETYAIQVAALRRRMESIGDPKIIIGVSGGLDSTQALLVATRTMDELKRDRSDILAYTMPGFATSDHTKSNAFKLCEALKVPCKEIDIRDASRQMLADMDHPFARGEDVFDITFENVQAGLRTDYLFRIANQKGGFVLGTGDLSELALGWCTYGVGDQMSHYGVNAGLPKTMIQHLIRWAAENAIFGEAATDVLQSILDTEISPELIPAGHDGEIQSTQDTNGPYELHDFFLNYHLQGYAPATIAYLAYEAWHDRSQGSWPVGIERADRHEYDLDTIVKWLKKFYWRFFTQHFKRTCMPNGPMVLEQGSLSPRSGWQMPSDMRPELWIQQLEEYVGHLDNK